MKKGHVHSIFSVEARAETQELVLMLPLKNPMEGCPGEACMALKVLKNEARFDYETIQEFADGECIFEEGDNSRDLYVVQSGEVRILKRAADDLIEIAKFQKGDFFGEIALLRSISRSAAAYAHGPTKLLILKPGGFLMKIRRDPTFAFEMLQQMSLRIQISNDRLLEFMKRYDVSKEEAQELMNCVKDKV